MSDPVEIAFGIPQASILGPIWFSLHLNNLGRIFDKYKYHFFAGDAITYIDAINERKLVDTSNN